MIGELSENKRGLLRTFVQVRRGDIELYRLRHPARLSRSRAHPVPWFPYRIRPRSPLLFCDREEQ